MRKRLVVFIIVFFALTSVVFAQAKLQKFRINTFEGGQNSADLPDSLKPNQGVSVQNAIINKKGRNSKRKGQDLFIEDQGSTAFRGVGTFQPDVSTSFIIVASGVDVMRAISSDSKWTFINTGFAQTTGKDTEFLQATDLLFTFNGTDPTDWYDGSTWTTNPAGSTSPPTATTGAWLRNYLFLAGESTQPDWVRFSNNLNPLVFTITDILKVNTGDGQKVVRVEPFKLNELIAYKERSIFLIDITGATPLDDWTIQPITKSTGLAATRSVVNLGNDQWFLSSVPFAVRSLVRTEFDKILLNLVSTSVQDFLDGTGDTTLNTSQVDKACAVLFDNKYILGIPTGTSIVNNTVLVFDFIVGGWYVIDGWFPAAWQVFDDRLFYIDANDGRVVECFTGTTGDMLEGPNAASEPTVAITWQYITKDIDFDNPENFKRLDAIEAEFDSTGNFDVDMAINLDNEGFQDVGVVNLAGNAVTLPVTLPFTLRAGGIARSTLQLQKFGEFKKIRIKATQDQLGETVVLHRITAFAEPKPWRREQ